MRIVFNNENKRFNLQVKDVDGNVVIDNSIVEEIQVQLKYAFNNETWLDYRFPMTDGFPEIKLLAGNFYFEITTEQARGARNGDIIVVVNYKVTDSNYTEGFNSFTEKGEIMKIVEV